MNITDGNATLSQILIILLGLAQTTAALTGGMATDRLNKKMMLISGLLMMSLLLGGIFFF